MSIVIIKLLDFLTLFILAQHRKFNNKNLHKFIKFRHRIIFDLFCLINNYNFFSLKIFTVTADKQRKFTCIDGVFHFVAHILRNDRQGKKFR